MQHPPACLTLVRHALVLMLEDDELLRNSVEDRVQGATRWLVHHKLMQAMMRFASYSVNTSCNVTNAAVNVFAVTEPSFFTKRPLSTVRS